MFKLYDSLHFILPEQLILLLSLCLLWSACQLDSSLLINLSLLLHFLSQLLIPLLQSLDVNVESIYVLVDECVLVLLFQECLCYLLQLLSATLLLYLLKVLVNHVHVLLVVFDNLYFLFVLSHYIL